MWHTVPKHSAHYGLVRNDWKHRHSDTFSVYFKSPKTNLSLPSPKTTNTSKALMFSVPVCGLHSPWWGALNRLPQVLGAGGWRGGVVWMGAGPQEASCFHRDKGLSGCILGRNLSHTSWFCSWWVKRKWQTNLRPEKLIDSFRWDRMCVCGYGEHKTTKRRPGFYFQLCSLTALDQGWFMGSFIPSAGSLLMMILTMCISFFSWPLHLLLKPN